MPFFVIVSVKVAPFSFLVLVHALEPESLCLFNVVCAVFFFVDPAKLEAMFRTALNEDQRAAVRKLVTAKDYALLLGMPGTGEWSHAQRHR